jgi:hypothetical protein
MSKSSKEGCATKKAYSDDDEQKMPRYLLLNFFTLVKETILRETFKVCTLDPEE